METLNTEKPLLRRQESKRHDASSAQSKLGTPSSHSSEQNISRGLQFVNVTDRAKLDRPARTQVRSQVMLDFHRRRRQGVEAPPTGHVQIGVPEAGGGTARRELKQQTNKLKMGPAGLQQWKPRKRTRIKEKVKADVIPSTGMGVVSSHETIAPIGEFRDTEQGREREDQSFETTSGIEASASERLSIEYEEKQWLTRLNESQDFVARPRALSPGAIDPFNAVSLLIKPRTQSLLNYYFNERLKSSWLMMPIRKGLLSLAIHDGAVFHACLSQYAASFNLRFQTGDPVESMQHRIAGMQMLNERLGDPIKGLSDGSVAAVANIAIYEAANGSLSSVQVHLNGLEQMVRMRGGIQEGGFAFFVQRLIAWCDLHCANALSQTPRFPALELPITSRPSTQHTPFNALSTSSFPPNIEPPASMDSILQTLRSLSITLKYVTPDLPEDIWYSDQVYAVQRRLFDLSYTELPQPPLDTMPLLEKSTAIAALMFSYAALRDIPFNFRVIATMVTNLHSTLELLFSAAGGEGLMQCGKGCPQSKPQMIFWALALGGMAAEGRPEYGWFCDKFARICGGLGLSSWEEVKVGLEGVLWTDQLDQVGQRLWNEINAIRRLQDGKIICDSSCGCGALVSSYGSPDIEEETDEVY